MHELSLAQALIDQASAVAARQAPGRRVKRVHLEVGELSGAVPAALRQAFAMLAAGTALAGTRLVMKRRPARFACRDCGRSFRAGAGPRCPKCGSARAELAAGRELRLAAIEVEDRLSHR
jgi:hydrogenase nickel incorporation protein HypA/HybF